MDPVKVSAKFVAFHWFSDRYAGIPRVQEKAVLFANIKWQAFIPLAHKGLGKLLLRIAHGRTKSRHAKRTSPKRMAEVA